MLALIGILVLIACTGLCLLGGFFGFFLSWARDEHERMFERYAADRAAR